jgi:hypothetical protein
MTEVAIHNEETEDIVGRVNDTGYEADTQGFEDFVQSLKTRGGGITTHATPVFEDSEPSPVSCFMSRSEGETGFGKVLIENMNPGDKYRVIPFHRDRVYKLTFERDEITV